MDTLCHLHPTDDFLQWLLDQFLFARNAPLTEVTVSDDGQELDLTMYAGHHLHFNYDKDLGSGTYGAVKMYYDSSNKVSLAVKYANNDINEASLADDLNRSSCRVLRMKQIDETLAPLPFKFGYQEAYVMELAENSYKKLLKQIKEKKVSEDADHVRVLQRMLFDLEQVRQQLVCILRVNPAYVYLDVKPANVLYKCENLLEPNKYSIFLGDLGGALGQLEPDGLFYPSTYPPHEILVDDRHIPVDATLQDKEGYLAWQLGVLLLHLAIALDTNKPRLPTVISRQRAKTYLKTVLYWNDFGDMPRDVVERVVAELHVYVCTLLNLSLDIYNYFDLDVSTRTSILTSLLPASVEPPKPVAPSASTKRRFQRELTRFFAARGASAALHPELDLALYVLRPRQHVVFIPEVPPVPPVIFDVDEEVAVRPAKRRNAGTAAAAPAAPGRQTPKVVTYLESLRGPSSQVSEIIFDVDEEESERNAKRRRKAGNAPAAAAPAAPGRRTPKLDQTYLQLYPPQ